MSSTLFDSVFSLMKRLDKAICGQSFEEAMDALNGLGTVTIDVTVLEKTRVGAAVAKLSKHEHGPVATKAKQLVLTWKKIAEVNGGVSRSTSGGSTTSTKQPAKTPAAPPPPKASDVGLPALPGTRSTLRKLLIDGLIRCAKAQNVIAPEVTPVEGEEPSTPSGTFPLEQIEDMARTAGHQLEAAIMAACGGPLQDRPEPAYHAQIKVVALGLTQNSPLAVTLLCGGIKAEDIATMTSKDLMSSEHKEALERVIKETQEARVVDWHKKGENRKKVLNNAGVSTIQGVLQCRRCKSFNVSHEEKQTRSADEPMTIFADCVDCGLSWRQ